MSWLRSLKRLWKGRDGSERVYVVDAAALHAAARPGERLSPKDQIQVLAQLSRFAEKEKIRVLAVFEGRSLREVADGQTYGAVQVFFAEDASKLNGRIMELVQREKGHRTVVVTARPELEKQVAELGASVLRASTFRKGFESAGEARNAPRRSKRARRTRRGAPASPSDERKEPAPSESAPAGSNEQSVQNLIDLVE